MFLLQVNYYERSLDLMRQSMEVERKDISQAFKVTLHQYECSLESGAAAQGTKSKGHRKETSFNSDVR